MRAATAKMAAPQAAPWKAFVPAAPAVNEEVVTAGEPAPDDCEAVDAGAVTSEP